MTDYDLYTFIIPAATFVFGTIGGGLAVALICASRQPVHPDTLLLDFLEESECNLFYNQQVEGGMWGFLDNAHKIIAAGITARSTITHAQAKATDAALAEIFAERIDRVPPAVKPQKVKP